MKFWIIVSLLFSLIDCKAQHNKLAEIRDLYKLAIFEKVKAIELYEVTKNSNIERDHKKFTYNAIAILLKSKFIINPIHKLKSFLEGKELLEEVIKYYPKDIELRFLRFCVQKSAPSILDYKINIIEDSQFILDNISKNPEELQQFIMPIFEKLYDGRTSYTSR